MNETEKCQIILPMKTANNVLEKRIGLLSMMNLPTCEHANMLENGHGLA
jgi:hypothetical protein